MEAAFRRRRVRKAEPGSVMWAYDRGNGFSAEVLNHEGPVVYASTNQCAPRWGVGVSAGGYSVTVSESCGPSAADRRFDGVQNPS